MKYRQLKTIALLYFVFALTSVAMATATVSSNTMNNARDFVLEYLHEFDPQRSFKLSNISEDSLLIEFFTALEQHTKRALFITDLDDTLIESKYLFTGIHYRRTKLAAHRAEIEKNHPDASKVDIANLLAKEFWDFARANPEVSVLDPLYEKLLKTAQSRGHIVLALTARPKDFMDVTFRQLKQIGIEFGKTLPADFSSENFNSTYLERGVLSSPQDYQHQRSTKATTLKLFLQHWNHQYGTNLPLTEIFYFDDSRRDIDEMKAMGMEIVTVQPLGAQPILHIIKSQAAEFFLKQHGYFDHLEEIGDWQSNQWIRTGTRPTNEEALKAINKNLFKRGCEGSLRKL